MYSYRGLARIYTRICKQVIVSVYEECATNRMVASSMDAHINDTFMECIQVVKSKYMLYS